MSATRLASAPRPATSRPSNGWLRCRPLLGFVALASVLLPAAASVGSVYLQVALVGNAVVAIGAVVLVAATRGRLGQRTVGPDA